MLIKKVDVESVQTALIAGDYKQLLSGLRRIGRPIKQAWLKSQSSNGEKYKFTSNSEFKNFFVKELENFEIFKSTSIEAIPQPITELKNQLSCLALFLTVWKDDPTFASESSEAESNLSEAEKNKKKRLLRQLIKYKTSLDKDDRYAINIALQTIAYILCQQSNNTIKLLEQKILPIHATGYALKDKDTEFQNIKTKQGLLDFIAKHIQNFSVVTSDAFAVNETPQEIEKIGQAISAFQTPNKKKKLIKYFAILLALIASLACGLSTGGAIFLLFPSLPILGIALGALIGFWGFRLILVSFHRISLTFY